MADFCKACSKHMFGKDTRDLADITLPEDWEDGFALTVICEGCGIIQVDPEGNCVTDTCLEHGKAGHGMPWLKDRGHV